MQYSLDSEYRKQWEEYHLDSGVVMDSRTINWRHVEWEKMVALVICVKDQRYVVKNTDPTFKAFVRYRTHHIGARPPDPQNTWVVGWTDGSVCFLNEFDFHTGELVKQNFVRQLKEIQAHVHSSVRDRLGLGPKPQA